MDEFEGVYPLVDANVPQPAGNGGNKVVTPQSSTVATPISDFDIGVVGVLYDEQEDFIKEFGDIENGVVTQENHLANANGQRVSVNLKLTAHDQHASMGRKKTLAFTYNPSRQETFNGLDACLDSARIQQPDYENTPRFLIAYSTNLMLQQVTPQMGEAFANLHNMQFISAFEPGVFDSAICKVELCNG